MIEGPVKNSHIFEIGLTLAAVRDVFAGASECISLQLRFAV